MASLPKPLKTGNKVAILRTNSKHTGGAIVNVRDTGRGTWFDVRVGGTPKEPLIASYRAGDLKRA